MATNMSQFSNALFMRSICNGISPNQTTCGRRFPDRTAAAMRVVVKVFADIEDKLGIEATHFQQLTVHMNQILAACALVQIVDVLRDQRNSPSNSCSNFASAEWAALGEISGVSSCRLRWL